MKKLNKKTQEQNSMMNFNKKIHLKNKGEN